MAGHPGLTRAAALLVSLTALSQVLGFVRDAVIASVFGTGPDLDAYLVAQGVMNLVLALMAGAMARAVVPPVSRAISDGDLGRAHRTIRTAATGTVLVLVLGSVAMFAGATQVINVLAPGFDQPTTDLAVELTRVLLVATAFVAATDVLAAATQAHGRFFHSGIQGVPFNLVMIAAAAGFGAAYGVHALAVGFVVGSAIRMLVQVPPLRAAGMSLRPALHLRDPDLREVVALVPPLLLTAAVANVNTLVDRAVGSAQGDGVIASLNFGWRIVTLVDSLLVVTFAAVLYPTFSAMGRPERRAELSSLVTRSAAVMLVVLAPATAMMLVAARPVVQLLFGRGEFDATAVTLTATAVTAYAVSATALGLRVLASRASFAVGDSRVPVITAVITMVVNVVGDLTLGVRYGVAGLAASTSLSLALGTVLLLVLLSRRHGAVALRPLGAAALRVTSAATAGGLLVWLTGLADLAGDASTSEALVRVVLSGAVILGTYVGGLLVLRSRELTEVATLVRERLLRRG